jgi:hypothetical protein
MAPERHAMLEHHATGMGTAMLRGTHRVCCVWCGPLIQQQLCELCVVVVHSQVQRSEAVLQERRAAVAVQASVR